MSTVIQYHMTQPLLMAIQSLVQSCNFSYWLSTEFKFILDPSPDFLASSLSLQEVPKVTSL